MIVVLSSAKFALINVMSEEERQEGGRPRRANGRVIYRECDSDDEDYEAVLLLKKMVAEKRERERREQIPALNPLQVELRQICRLGDREALKTFLANNPEINLDFKDPDGEFLSMPSACSISET